jgi:hypothetical protein
MDTSVAPVPVPDKATVCGLLLAVSVNVSVALRAPMAVGANVTETVQLAPAANVLGQLEVTGKSARLLVTLVIEKDVDWLFVRVTVWDALVVPKA